MPQKLFICVLLVILNGVIFAMEPAFARDPAISPDGSEICFVYNSDLWIVPFKGGNARRLTATEASEWGPAWSPDGSLIAFNSNREQQSYVFTISPQGGEAKPVFRESLTVVDWFNDSQNLLCTRYGFRNGSGYYKVNLDGTRPVLLAEIGDRYGSLSPKNDKIIFNRYGDPFREAYRGSLNGDLWQIDLASGEYSRLTSTELTERYPRYSHDTNSVYFCASDGRNLQLVKVAKGNFDKPEQLTNFDTWSARDITIARKSDRIVFELFSEIWSWQPGKAATKLEINIPEDQWEDTKAVERLPDYFEDYMVSDDNLVVAFKAGYDLFAMPVKGGEAKRITTDHGGSNGMIFLPNSHELIVQKRQKGRDNLFRAVIDSTISIQPLDWFGKEDYYVEMFNRDMENNLMIHYRDETETGKIAIADSTLKIWEIVEAPSAISSVFAINKEKSHALFMGLRPENWMREQYLYDFATKEFTKLYTDDQWVAWQGWMPGNKSVLMQRSGGIWRMDLVPRDEFEHDKDNWREVFASGLSSKTEPSDSLSSVADSLASPADEDTEANLPKSLELVKEGIRDRIYPVIQDSEYDLIVVRTLSDSTFLYMKDGSRQSKDTLLMKANIYGKGIEEEHNFGRQARNFRIAGDVIYFQEGNSIKSYNINGGKKVEFTARFDYTFDYKELNKRVFEEVWGAFGLNFYDSKMHGQNWNELYDRFAPYLDKVRNMDDLSMIVDELIGEVNASHTGFYPRMDKLYPSKSTAHLGLELDYSLPQKSGIRVKTVLPTTRLADLYKLRAGAVITSIDGISVTETTPLDSLLADKTGKKIRLTFTQDGVSTDAVITGLSWSEQRALWYKYKTRNRAAEVERLTQGRVGYIHIPAMGSEDWSNFYRDLFRDNFDKEALIIDVRGNVGGRIHDQIISLLQKQQYGFSSSRRWNKQPAPEPGRMWGKPSIVLVDEHSFSDGEIFPIVYQELKLGKVVGYPSSGAVIGTWQYDLIDGSSMRMPGSGWYKLDGTNMEGTGAKPDIIVELSPNDLIADRDLQLQRAVQEILNELDNAGN